MPWIELIVDTTDEAVDWVYTLLAQAIAASDIHIHKYEASDNEIQSSSQWNYTIQIYLAKNDQIHQRIDAIAAMIAPLQRTGLINELQTFVVTERPIDRDLEENPTKFLVRRIGDRFVVVSADANYQTRSPQEIVLHLQNSLAFGSGLHPATILSLRLIEKYFHNWHKPNNEPIYALDLGSGSGILTVAMAKLGIEVLAIDNDPIAVAATEDAIARNQVSDVVTVSSASLGTASQLGHWLGSDRPASTTAIAAAGQFDLIVANIFARVHISLAAEFAQALKPPSATTSSPRLLITAGYTSDRADDVIAAMQAVGFQLGDRQQMDEWTAIAFQK